MNIKEKIRKLNLKTSAKRKIYTRENGSHGNFYKIRKKKKLRVRYRDPSQILDLNCVDTTYMCVPCNL